MQEMLRDRTYCGQAGRDSTSIALSGPYRAGGEMRQRWIDVVKGIAMVCVILGHSGGFGLAQ